MGEESPKKPRKRSSKSKDRQAEVISPLAPEGESWPEENHGEHLEAGRLHEFPPEELAFYWRLFLEAGGNDGSPVLGADAGNMLQRSGLTREALRSIWELSDVSGAGELDFNAFCVACRLVAHAQHYGPETGISPAAISEVPGSAPWFQEPHLHPAPSAVPQGSTAEFDFEATAFGVDGSPGGQPSRQPQPSDNVASTEAAVFSLSSLAKGRNTTRKVGTGASASNIDYAGAGWGSGIEAGDSGGTPAVSLGDPADLGSVPSLAAVLCNSSMMASRSNPAATQSARLGRELVEGRAELDKGLARKSQLEARIQQLWDRLNSCREHRSAAKLQLSTRRASVGRLSSSLDFTRHQIDEFERLVASLREARRAFSKEELLEAKRLWAGTTSPHAAWRNSSDTSQGHPVTRQGSDTLAGYPFQGPSLRELGQIEELAERARRTARQKSDLQAKQQLLLASQHQALQERSYAQKAFEQERTELLRLQAQRLRVNEERSSTCRDAAIAAEEAGLGPVGPGVLKELLQQQSSETQRSWSTTFAVPETSSKLVGLRTEEGRRQRRSREEEDTADTKPNWLPSGHLVNASETQGVWTLFGSGSPQM